MSFVSIFVSILATLTMLVLLVASAPNSSPRQSLEIKLMMSAVGLIGLAGPGVSIWAMLAGRPSLALWAGLSPTIFVAALFIFLMTVER